MILGLETSCDDTSVALLDEKGLVLSSLSVNQDSFHRPFGGVVPEVASRQHTENLLPLIDRCFEEARAEWPAVKAVAVTSRPGLIGSLLVGVVTAKTLAMARGLDLIAVNHIEGHLLAAFLRDREYQPPAGFGFPYLGLAVSGGHTHLFHVEKVGRYRLLGQTADDAAGEAFDKFAKMMKLGFPGGVRVDHLARTGRRDAYKFPRSFIGEDNLNFSFSGLKSHAMREIEHLSEAEREARKADLCASYQEAIVDVLISKLEKAAKATGLKNWTITGGVSANSRLRERAEASARAHGACLALPPLRYCTDNAAMIAMAGLMKWREGRRDGQDLSPSAASLPGDWS
jgi:N6-L-threonylcarbamoyladenine synthase